MWNRYGLTPWQRFCWLWRWRGWSSRQSYFLQAEQAGAEPIIAMTANAFAENTKEGLDAGINGYKAKPTDIQALFVALGTSKSPQQKAHSKIESNGISTPFSGRAGE